MNKRISEAQDAFDEIMEAATAVYKAADTTDKEAYKAATTAYEKSFDIAYKAAMVSYDDQCDGK